MRRVLRQLLNLTDKRNFTPKYKTRIYLLLIPTHGCWNLHLYCPDDNVSKYCHFDLLSVQYPWLLIFMFTETQ